jgi:hypothetical protein
MSTVTLATNMLNQHYAVSRRHACLASNPILVKTPIIQQMSLPASVAAMYSASVVERATHFCPCNAKKKIPRSGFPAVLNRPLPYGNSSSPTSHARMND